MFSNIAQLHRVRYKALREKKNEIAMIEIILYAASQTSFLATNKRIIRDQPPLVATLSQEFYKYLNSNTDYCCFISEIKFKCNCLKLNTNLADLLRDSFCAGEK